MACRWCHGPTMELAGQTVCQGSCSEAPLFTNRCIDCRKEFRTGNIKADQCERCEERESNRHTREAAGDAMPHTGYSARMRAERANRLALALKGRT